MPTRLFQLKGSLASLLAGVLLLAAPLAPLRAAEQLEVQLDGLALPIDLQELEAWSRNPSQSEGDLATWLTLVEPRSRAQLLRLLRAPLVRDRSLTQQLLASWAGQRLLDELGALVRLDTGNAGPVLYQVLTRLLQRQNQVTTIELLRALPSRRITVDVDGVLQLAGQWQRQLQQQQQAIRSLRALPLRQLSELPPSSTAPLPAQPLRLTVPHRPQPLQLRLRQGHGRSWVLLTPGLGGSTAQLDWLAEGLQQRGWTVLALDHPGSDEQAVRELLDGQRPAPGAETLSDRVRDLQAVVRAVQNGPLPHLGERVVLMGHSLGGVSSLLAAGLRPEPGLARRCDRELTGIPLTNLSQLLQCQLPDVALPVAQPLAQPLAGVVSLNGFGSLLWPRQGLRSLPAPVLLVGGSLDLITPPLSEQLRLFLPAGDRRSRLVLLEGGSHFSPVRIPRGNQALFQLGEELVGVEPGRVQALTLRITAAFLDGLDPARLMEPLPPQRRELGGVIAYVLNRARAQSWWSALH